MRLANLKGSFQYVDTSDVSISARKGRVTVRSGKGAAYREVALNAEVRDALHKWLSARKEYPDAGSSALFLNRRDGRLSARAVDMIVRRFAACVQRPTVLYIQHRNLRRW